MESIKCDLCGFIEFEILLDKGDSKIYQCLNCSLVFIYPQVLEGELKSCYQNDYGVREKEQKRFDNKLRKLNSSLGNFILKRYRGYCNLRPGYVSVLKKIFGSVFQRFYFRNIIPSRGEGVILDIGSGSGMSMALLKSIGWDTYAVEVNKYACEYAQSLGIKVFCGELEQANFLPEHFDVIRIIQVLEHVSSPLKIFKEIARLLKPGGIVYLETPNQNSFAFRNCKEQWLGMGGHLYVFSLATLKILCEKSGLHIKKFSYKSSKGITLVFLDRFFRNNFHCGLSDSAAKNKLFIIFIVSPLRFIFKILRRADTVAVEIEKKSEVCGF